MNSVGEVGRTFLAGGGSGRKWEGVGRLPGSSEKAV